MPGMMDTILDLGLTDSTVSGLARVAGAEFAADCLRRLREGYAAVMGWIQVTAQRWPPIEREELLVDVAPQMQAAGARMPYFAFGVRPTFFDAPSTDDPDYEFRAAAFLTASPDAVMTPVVEPLCGFRWGYRIVDETPNVDPLEPAGAAEWAWMRSTLERDYPGWTFGDLDRLG